jgi:WhiB family redox-sensing transcriptional regulator
MSVLFSELLVPGWAEGPEAKIGVGYTADASFNLPCHTAEPETFFSENPATIAMAKALCGSCPLKAQCLEGAISRQEPCGVWGGELFEDGKAIAAKRKAGRPRLTPLVEVEVNSVANSVANSQADEMELAS